MFPFRSVWLFLTADRTQQQQLRWEKRLNGDTVEWSSNIRPAFFLPCCSLSSSLITPSPIFSLSIHLLAAFEVPPLQVQNAVSWESGVKEGRGNTPTTSKGFSWVVGRWGLFLALWCPFKRLAWRWRRRENRGRGYRKLMPHSHCCHTAMSYSKQTFFYNKMHIVFGMNGMNVQYY